jgi:Uma2 family endonuclease
MTLDTIEIRASLRRLLLIENFPLQPTSWRLDFGEMKPANPAETPVKGAQVWPLSVAAYHTLGEAGLIPKSTELLYGVVYKKMSKSPLHSALVRRLLKLLRSIPLPGRFVTSELPITCENSEPEPDIAIVAGTEDDFWQDHPTSAELVIEVCITSYQYDESKLRAYARAGVKECWLVLGAEKTIEVLRKPSNGQFTERKTSGHGGTLSCEAVPEFTVQLDKLFAR